MAERLFGLETEYAFAVLGPGDRARMRSAAMERFMNLARARLVHLPGIHEGDLFLANGSRLYVDHGMHPELCTPECPNPWDLVRYVKAGERLLESVADELVRTDDSVSEVVLARNNIGYTGKHVTWGCHESYLHHGDPGAFPSQLIPHLASRIVYTGGGGFDSKSPGIEFMVSPRVAHLTQAISGDSTSDRGIYHTKDEALATGGAHRLHLLCGESLSSEWACWLKVATTGLVVAMIQAGLRPGDAVQLGAPLRAMGRFARDATCTAPAGSPARGIVTALDIQEHYLGLAEQHVGAEWMPPWAAEACAQWRAVLERLRRAPSGVATSLDWAIKRTLYLRHMARRGFQPEAVRVWTQVLRIVAQALARADRAADPITAALILGPGSPVSPEVRRLTDGLRDHGQDWDRLDDFLALRQQLFALDTRFAQVGPNGVFRALDRAGLLEHHMPGVDNIEHAMANPPAIGRASLRGRCIQRLAGRNGRVKCNWNCILDFAGRRRLDLSNPFASDEHWEELDSSDTDDESIRDTLQRLRNRSRTREPATPDGFRVGQRVVLGRHDMVNGSDNWHPRMDEYVGREATIINVIGNDPSGCHLVWVDVDHGQWAWRTQNLRPVQNA